MARPFRGITRCAALLTLLAPLATPAHAQGAITAYLALKGSAQGPFKGSTTAPGHTGEITAISLTESQPYGAATPVLRVVTDIGVAPQVVRALVTNEMLQTPSIVFLKAGRAGMQQVYQIKALRGYVTSATISADDAHMPTLTFDLLLSGGTTATNETGAATTAPPPSFTGNVPSAQGVVLTGEFKGQTTGSFPPSPNAPMHQGIILDSISVAMNAPVINGATSGRVIVHPLVIARPASEDATLFDAAQTAQEPFTDIVLRIYEPQPNGTRPDVFDIETKGACMYIGSTPCPSGSGLASSRPGTSAGSSPSGGRTATASVLAARTGMRRVNDASTAMQFQIPIITLQNRLNQTSVTYSSTTGAAN